MGFLVFLFIVGLILTVLLPRFLKKLVPVPIKVQEFNQQRYEELRRKYQHIEDYEVERWGDDDDRRTEYEEFNLLKLEYAEYQKALEHNRRAQDSRVSPGMARGLGIVARVLGTILIIIAILGTSVFNVPQNYSAHIMRNLGGNNMADGQIIAKPGQNGPQADILPPGWKFQLLIKIHSTVEIVPDVEVPEGKVLTLVAREGRDKPAEQYFADPWSTEWDKKKMLENASYALQPDDNGNIIRLQKGPQVVAFPPAKYRFNQYVYDYRIDEPMAIVEPGYFGIMKFNYGKYFDHELLNDTASEFFAIFADQLIASNRPVKEVAIRAKIVPENWKPKSEGQEFDYAQLEDPESQWFNYFPEKYNELTREMVKEAKLVPRGYQGVCWDVLTEGKYALNPQAVQVFAMEKKVQTLNYWGGFVVNDSAGTVDYDKDYKVKEGAADVATDAISKDGFRMFIEFRILAKVTPRQAPYAFVMWGDWSAIEDKDITPDARSVMRNNAQNASCLDYFRQREQQEINTYMKLWESQLRKGITCVDVNYGEIRIDPKLLATQTRKVLAEQNQLAWKAEQAEQDERINTERKRALADQQAELTKADIAKQKAAYYNEEQELRGKADANYAREFASGQSALY